MASEASLPTTAEEYNYSAFTRSTTQGMSTWFRNTVRVGELSPDFTLTALDGTPVRLSDLRGKYVVLEFGAIT